MSVHISFLGSSLGLKLYDCKLCHYQGTVTSIVTSCSSDKSRRKLFLDANASSLSTSISRHPALCKAIDTSNNRSHESYMKYRGSSKTNKHGKGRENSENLEDKHLFPTKTGSHMESISNNQRSSAVATPGKREKDIVELFKKVQTQLRERAAMKEEKSYQLAQHDQGARGGADSILKLLRSHSFDFGKKTGSSDDDEYDSDKPEITDSYDEPEKSELFVEEQDCSFYESVEEDVAHEHKPLHPRRSISKFNYRSPALKVKSQPVFSVEEYAGSSDTSMPLLNIAAADARGSKKPIHAQEFQPEALHLFESEDLQHSVRLLEGEGEVMLDETDGEETDGDDSDETDGDDSVKTKNWMNMMQSGDLNSLKLMELRGLAKSRGIRGYSKLKKSVLVEVLNAKDA